MRTDFEIFLLRNRISKKKLAEMSQVNRSTFNRWVRGLVTPRGDSLELVMVSLQKLTNKKLSPEDVGLA